MVLLQGNKATVEESTAGESRAQQSRAEILSTQYSVLGSRTGYRILCIVAIPPREMNALGCGR